MFYDGQPLLLKAVQVEEAPLEKGNSVTITTCWNGVKRVIYRSHGGTLFLPN